MKRNATKTGAGAKKRGRPRKQLDPAVLRKVRAALMEVKPGLSARQVKPDASVIADLGVDSLALAQLSLSLEARMGRPVFLGDVLANVEDPARITVRQLVEHLS